MPVTVASLLAILDLDKRGFDKGMKSADAMLTGLSTAVATAGIQLLEQGVGALVGTMADGVSKAQDLESQLDAIGAISGATDEQVAGLKDTIMDLGLDPKLKVSAFEAAQAIEELAAGGVALEDIMNGAAKGTVALANATGADFAQSATIAADSMAIFGIEAKNLEQVIDGVSSVIVSSKFDANDYALALAQAGGVAKTSGVEFDDFNTAIAGIAPLFASGSDAGTSFKTMLQRLTPSTDPAVEAMTELGIITEESGNRFYDAQGNLKSMAEISEVLSTALSGLSEAQRNEALSTIFGTDAMRAAVGLMELGGKGFTDLQVKMSNTSGMDAAAQRMTNLKGATEILSGVVETLQIQYGDKLIPKLTEMANKATEFAQTQGPALVDSLANLTLGAIDFGERATPALTKGLTIITGLGDSTNKLVEAGLELGKVFGIASEKASEMDGVMLLLNAVIDASMAPFTGLKALIDSLVINTKAVTAVFRGWKSQLDSLVSSMSSLNDSLPDWLRPGSPPPLAYALQDIKRGLSSMPSLAGTFGGGMTPIASGGGGSSTINVNIGGVSATSTVSGDPATEALRLTIQLLREQLNR